MTTFIRRGSDRIPGSAYYTEIGDNLYVAFDEDMEEICRFSMALLTRNEEVDAYALEQVAGKRLR